YQQRWNQGDRPARKEYIDRFPEHAAALHDLKPRWNCAQCKQKGISLDDEAALTAICPRCHTPFPINELFVPSAKEPSATSLNESGQFDLRDYELLGELGQGGMGEVYRSRDPSLGCDLAIKVLL